jgi:hypothetical protein
MMNRSRWISVVTVTQLLYAITLASLSVYLLVLSRWSEPRSSPKADEVRGLLIASAVFAGPALLTLLGWFGLLRSKLWGWWLAFLADAAVLCMFIYSMIDDGWRVDWDMATFSALSAILPMLLLLPRVRKFYLQPAKAQSLQSSS